jgi:hypothetical protein
MINHLNNLTSTRTTGESPLVEQLAKRADVNRDGKVSSEEFSDFLTSLLDKAGETSGTKPAGAGGSSGTAGGGR